MQTKAWRETSTSWTTRPWRMPWTSVTTFRSVRCRTSKNKTVFYYTNSRALLSLCFTVTCLKMFIVALKIINNRWELWSSGFVTRLEIWGFWVRIPATFTEWTFSRILVVKIVMFVWKDENKQKEDGDRQF